MVYLLASVEHALTLCIKKNMQPLRKKVRGTRLLYWVYSTNSCRTVLVFLERLKSEGASSARSGLEDEFGNNFNGDGQEDVASDVQEGAQSTVGSLVQRNGVVRPFCPASACAY